MQQCLSASLITGHWKRKHAVMPADVKNKYFQIRGSEYFFFFFFKMRWQSNIEQKYMPHHNLIIAIITPWQTNRYTVQAKGNVETGTEIAIQCECMFLCVQKCLNRLVSWILFWGGQRWNLQQDGIKICFYFVAPFILSLWSFIHRACPIPPQQRPLLYTSYVFFPLNKTTVAQHHHSGWF